jgi:hypothetical protein
MPVWTAPRRLVAPIEENDSSPIPKRAASTRLIPLRFYNLVDAYDRAHRDRFSAFGALVYTRMP